MGAADQGEPEHRDYLPHRGRQLAEQRDHPGPPHRPAGQQRERCRGKVEEVRVLRLVVLPQTRGIKRNIHQIKNLPKVPNLREVFASSLKPHLDHNIYLILF